MINSVVLVGRVTKELELQRTNNGSTFVKFTIAVDGFGNEDTNFIPCIVWNKQADNMVNFIGKGSLIGVTGRISVRKYESNGENRTFTEISVANVQFLESKSSKTERTQDFITPKPTPKPKAPSALDKLFEETDKVKNFAPTKEDIEKKKAKDKSTKDTIDWLEDFI